MTELSRRDFLKVAAAGGLAAGMALCGFGLTGCGNDGEEGKGVSGKQSATVKGKNGDVTVTVTVQDGKIIAVDISAPNEIPNIGGLAIEELPQQIISAQSFEVDGVAGATVTSNAIKQAGQKAYDQIMK